MTVLLWPLSTLLHRCLCATAGLILSKINHLTNPITYHRMVTGNEGCFVHRWLEWVYWLILGVKPRIFRKDNMIIFTVLANELMERRQRRKFQFKGSGHYWQLLKIIIKRPAWTNMSSRKLCWNSLKVLSKKREIESFEYKKISIV